MNQNGDNHRGERISATGSRWSSAAVLVQQLQERVASCPGTDDVRQPEPAPEPGGTQAGAEAVDSCPLCQGSGHLEWDSLHVLAASVPVEAIRWCECSLGEEKRREYEGYRAALLRRKLGRVFEQARIPARFRDLTLETVPLAQREGKRRAIAAARMFIVEGAVTPARLGEYDQAAALKERESIRGPTLPRRSLVLSGPLGVGKTGILTPVLRHALEQGKPALWIEFYDFCLEVQSGYQDGTANDKLVAARQAPLILLDDVGDLERRGPETDDKRRILWSVLNARHGDDLPTLVTTNLDEQGFRRQFGGRVSDRLWEMAFVVPVGGVNLRRVEVFGDMPDIGG